MSAALVLVALAEAGMELVAEAAAVHLDGPLATLPPELVARARVVKPALWQVASGAWCRELVRWPLSLQDEWSERAAIRHHDGHQPRELAERAAFLELREVALAPVADLLGAARTAFGAVTVTLHASTRPAIDDGDDEDARPVRSDARSVVHRLCCGGCGCPSLTDGGLGRCARCGWRRRAVQADAGAPARPREPVAAASPAEGSCKRGGPRWP